MLKKFWELYRLEFSEFYLKDRTIFWLSVIFVLLKIPSLFEPYWYGDEGVSLTVGMAIRRGYLLYRDVFDNKPPVLYLIAALVNGNLFFFKLFLLFWEMLGLQVFYRIGIFLFGSKKPLIVLGCSIAYVLLTTTPIFEANIVNGEIIFLVFSLAGWYFGLIAKNYYLSGLMFALAFLTKVPALFDMWPLLVWFAAAVGRKVKPVRLSDVIKLTLAFGAPIALTSIFFVFRGGFFDFLSSVFIQMVGYTSSWGVNNQTSSIAGLVKNGTLIKGLVLLVIGGLLWRQWHKQKSPPLALLAVYWLLSSLFGATISGRPYPHYLIQIVPPLCLCIGYLLIAKLRFKLLIVLALALLVITYKHYRFGFYPNLGYQKNFVSMVAKGMANKDTYYRFFDSSLNGVYETAGFINAYTQPNDKIFIWSNYAQLYAMAKRLPATKYVVAYHILEKEGDNENYVAENLSRAKLVVVDKNIKSNDPMERSLYEEYYLAEELTNYRLYIRK